MIRKRALEISDALAAHGVSHTIDVGVHDGHMPRERYYVSVKPTISYKATDITLLQRIADSLRCEIGYIAGAFTFAEQK